MDSAIRSHASGGVATSAARSARVKSASPRATRRSSTPAAFSWKRRLNASSVDLADVEGAAECRQQVGELVQLAQAVELARLEGGHMGIGHRFSRVVYLQANQTAPYLAIAATRRAMSAERSDPMRLLAGT